MKLKLSMDMENDEFGNGNMRLALLAVGRLLRTVAEEMIHNEKTSGSFIDLNGNKVGEWEVEE